MIMKRFYLLALLLLIPLLSMGQIAKFKAVFTLNFIRYIGWSESSKQGDFVIGVLRNKEVADYLREQSYGKPFGFQKVVIKEYRSVEEIDNCQVVFVSSAINMRSSGAFIMDKAKQYNTLIIAESEGATQYGATINFVVRENALKFELHKGNAARQGLQFSSRLEGMAAAINL